MVRRAPGSVKNVYNEGFAKTVDFLLDERIKIVLAAIEEKHIQGRKFLDMGCGDGAMATMIGRRIGATRISGFDIAGKAVRLAKGRGVEAVQMDIDESNLPFKNNFFDVIFCGNLIELVTNADHLLEEMYRVLSPKGIAIVTFPNACAWGSRIAVPLGFLPFFSRVSTRYDLGKLGMPMKRGGSTGFIRLFSVQSFRVLVGLYQFKVESLYGVSTRFLPFPLTLIDSLLCRSPSLAFKVIALLRK